MADDFSRQQRELIDQMVRNHVNSLVSRPEAANGEPRVPDVDRTVEIARKEILEWSKRQPRWWQVHKYVHGRLAAGGVVVLVALWVVDIVRDAGVLPQALHAVARTDARIDGRLTHLLDQISEPPPARIARGTMSALRSMAENQDPTLVSAVRNTAAAHPVLVFHGQAILGGSVPVNARSAACRDLGRSAEPSTEEGYGSEPASDGMADPAEEDALTTLPLGLVVALSCGIRAEMSGPNELLIPFRARLQPDGTRTPHRVSIHVRASRLRLRPDIGANPVEDSVSFVANPVFPRLNLHYLPSNQSLISDRTGAQRVDGDWVIDLGQEIRGQGYFFFGEIGKVIADAIAPKNSGHFEHFDLVHYIRVSLPADTTRDDTCIEQRLQRDILPDVACTDAYAVTVFVMVNLGFNDAGQ